MRAFGRAKAAQEQVSLQAESNLNQASAAAQVRACVPSKDQPRRVTMTCSTP